MRTKTVEGSKIGGTVLEQQETKVLFARGLNQKKENQQKNLASKVKEVLKRCVLVCGINSLVKKVGNACTTLKMGSVPWTNQLEREKWS